MLTAIDHLLLAVSDLAAAAQTYTRLGFHISGGGDHPSRGTANHIIVLDPEYLELIAVQDSPLAQTATGPQEGLVQFLQQYHQGFFNFAIASDDLDADVARLRANGLPVSDPVEGALVSPKGVQRGWRTALLPGDQGQVFPFLIQHDSTGAEKQKRLAGDNALAPHPLGAQRLAWISIAAPTLEAGLALYAQGYGLSPADPTPPGDGAAKHLDAEEVFLPLPVGGIRILAPRSTTSPLVAFTRERGIVLYSVTIAVKRLSATVEWLRQQQIAVEFHDSSHVLPHAEISPTATEGVQITLIEEQKSKRPRKKKT